MPSLVRAFASLEARDGDADSSTLSTGGIVGVAIAGALFVFISLSLALVCFARRQERRRQLEEQAESRTTGSPSQDGLEEDKLPFPRRLRKRSIIETEFDPETVQQWHRISLPVIPPVFSRRPSLNLIPFRDDVHSSPGPSQRSEKERGRELSELRRQSSWIDEDALHGPRISKPRSKPSLLSLRRKLSFRQPLSNPGLLGSPTLPHAEHKANPAPVERSIGEALPARDRCPSSGTVLYGPQTASAPQTSSTGTQQPPAVKQQIRNTNTIAYEAAEQLAGQSRLPDFQRPPRICTSTTDLSAILQLTAARLEDGNNSPRRQTMFARSTTRSTQQLVRFVDACINADDEAPSPTRSQKSAPEVMIVAELEAADTVPPKRPTPSLVHRSSHERQVSHMSHVSQFSIVSEADSMLASRRGSQPDVETALSSPSRHARAKESAQVEQSHQELRPTTSGSDSSALSTLYSVDEEAEGTQTRCTVIERTIDTQTTLHQSYDRCDKSPKLPFENGDSARMGRLRRGTLGQFHGPRPMPRPDAPAMPASPQARAEKPVETPLHFSIYAVDDDPFIAESSQPQNSLRLSQIFKDLPSNANRPEIGSKTRESTRALSSKPVVLVTKATGTPTPTPSPKSLKITVPPPNVLRPGSPTQDAVDRRTSPALSSRSGASSIHEIHSHRGHRMSLATTVGYSTSTLFTTPSPEGSPTGPPQRPESRAGFHYDPGTTSEEEDGEDEEQRDMVHDNMPQHLFGTQSRSASEGSVYSQDQGEEVDRLPPLRLTAKKSNNNNTNNNIGNRDSTQLASVVAELRRMNSQVSLTSGYSAASTASSTTLPAAVANNTVIPEEETSSSSPTLQVLRGGGFSPGKRGGTSRASRNYLSVGSPEKQTPHGKRFSDGALVARRGGSCGATKGSRRGTVGAGVGSGTGLAGRLRELDRHMVGVSKGVVTRSPAKSSAMRLRTEASLESLYDEHEFLKGTPIGTPVGRG
ncbi:hypothetical protein PG997_013479 [Apiospora hydei]|uniref:Uncharacterized protein n=1 Tax=Apiospora hydei TaxID=1337664 RepID=A0ABR1V6B3_9PEZI